MKRGGSISGILSLIMIFSVLCLSVFAVLTVAAAEREHTLAQLTAERAASYYEADGAATEILNRLARGEDPAVLSMSVGTPVETVQTAEGISVSFSVPVGEVQSLEVAALLSEGGLRVTKWQLAYSEAWEPDESIEFWDMGETLSSAFP